MREMIYPAICSRPSGPVVRVWASASEINFAGVGTFPIPCWPLWLVAEASETELAAIGQAHAGGYAMLIHSDGRIENLGAAHGTNCVGLMRTPSGLMAVWVSHAGTKYSARLVAGGDVQSFDLPPDVRGTSQGFIGFDVNGVPAWTDTNRAVVKGGALLTLPTHNVRGWTVGQSNRFFGVEAVHDDGRIRKVAAASIQLPPQLAAHPDGSVEACFAFETDDPSSLFVPEEAWTALPVDPSAPAASPAPPVIATTPPIGPPVSTRPVVTTTPTIVPPVVDRLQVQDQTGELLNKLPKVDLSYVPPKAEPKTPAQSTWTQLLAALVNIVRRR